MSPDLDAAIEKILNLRFLAADHQVKTIETYVGFLQMRLETYHKMRTAGVYEQTASALEDVVSELHSISSVGNSLHSIVNRIDGVREVADKIR